jgi:uncharacterized protein (TIGR02996 family)
MDNGEAMLAAIAANPGDDTVRLAYADLLDERGRGDDHDHDRAALIRVQCALAACPPEPRKLFVADGAGTLMEGLGVALTPHGGGHYSASSLERGLSTETFAPNERVDVYAHLARKDRIGWIRGLKYVKHVPERHQIVFRKDADSKPWAGTELRKREAELLRAHPEWSSLKCEGCHGHGVLPGRPGGNQRRRHPALPGVRRVGRPVHPPPDRLPRAERRRVRAGLGPHHRHAPPYPPPGLRRVTGMPAQ